MVPPAPGADMTWRLVKELSGRPLGMLGTGWGLSPPGIGARATTPMADPWVKPVPHRVAAADAMPWSWKPLPLGAADVWATKLPTQSATDAWAVAPVQNASDVWSAPVLSATFDHTAPQAPI